MLNLLKFLRRHTRYSKLRWRVSSCPSIGSISAIEQLESRQLLTVVFNTQFGAETLVAAGPFTSVVNNATVHLLLWGNTWDTPTGPSSAVAIAEAKAILNSTYLKGLTEYNSNGVISSFDSYVDTASNPSATFNPGNLVGASLTEAQTELTNVIAAGNLPGPGTPANLTVAPIYVIMTDPAHSGGTNGGYNTSGTVSSQTVNIASMGTSASGSNVNPISEGLTFSHEMAERMTDTSDPGGVRLNLPATIPASLGFSGAQQIGDGEAEPSGQAHYYLPLNGAFVQPFWSNAFQAFIVPDGNTEQFTMNPIWNTTTNVFSGTFNLVVNGDQLANKNDTISIGLDGTGKDLQVNLDGQTSSFFVPEIASITVNGLTGNDTLTINNSNGNPLSGATTLTFNGGGGSDTLIGPNSANTWQITGADKGNLNTAITFNGVGNLTGGSSSDQFNFSAGASVSGNIDGGGGGGALNYASFAGPITVNLQSHTANAIGGTFSNINHVAGSSAADLLIGPDSSSTWTLNGPNAGSVAGVGFSSFENLTGGSAADSFVFQNGGSVSGSIVGGLGSNTLDYSPNAGPVAVNLRTSTASGIGNTFADIATFVGSAGSDQLIGPDSDSVWTLTGLNAGYVAGATFSSFENLLGGSGADAFVFKTGGGVSGNIDGGAGSNTLDYSPNAGPVTVNLQSSTASGIGGTFSNFATFVGSAGSDQLIGPDSDSVWTLTALKNAGYVAGATFSSFENLLGGSGADAFVFKTGGGVSGNIDGGAGSNTLDYSQFAGPITVNLQTGTANAIGGTFGDINNLIGTGASDLLIGPDTTSTWKLSGPNAGSVAGIAFVSFENLTGGSAADSFVFQPGGVSGNIDGGGGINTLDYSQLAGPITVNLQTHTASNIGGTFSNISNLIGSAGPDLLIGPDSNTVWTLTGLNAGIVAGVTFSSFENLLGGSGNDTFVIDNGGGVSGGIDGGGGFNTLDYSNYVGDLIVDLPLGISTGIGGNITNIQGITGGIGNDLFVGDAKDNSFTGGTMRSIIIGGGGADTITGGKGDNILIGGTTLYDTNLTALLAIMKEWTRTDLSYEQRLADLISEGPPSRAYNGPYELNNKTVFDDTSADVVTGGNSLDWIFLDRKQDSLVNRHAGDHLTNL